MERIFDCFDALPVQAEINNSPSMVMVAGYTPDDLRIKELLLAGERLEAFKYGYNEQLSDYDFDAGVDVPDDFDSVDDFMDEMEAQEIYNQTMQRIEASMKEREAMYSRRLREEQEEEAWKAQKAQAKPEPEPTKEAE